MGMVRRFAIECVKQGTHRNNQVQTQQIQALENEINNI